MREWISRVGFGIVLAILTGLLVQKDSDELLKLDYQGSFDRLQIPQYIFPKSTPCSFHPTSQSEFIHIKDVENQPGSIFVMLNGQNHGKYISWFKSDDCLYQIAFSAAKALGADERILSNGLRIFDQQGIHVTTAAHIDKIRIIHILLDNQVWVWPGIEIGHIRQIDGSITMTTLSLRPLVYQLDSFISQTEANYILQTGLPKVKASFLPFSTNDEHWLPESNVTIDIRRRTAQLARLPSPICTEALRLNRYLPGQINGVHTDYVLSDDLFHNFFLPTGSHEEMYLKWTEWAQLQLKTIDPDLLPADVQPGQELYPDPNDKVRFQHALLRLFIKYHRNEIIPFPDHFPRLVELAELYLDASSKENPIGEIIEHISRLRLDFWTTLVLVWEHYVNHPAVSNYSPPDQPLFAVSHYFRWIRWCKEQVEQYRNELQPHVLPGGSHYPSYDIAFQDHLIELLLEEYSTQQLITHGLTEAAMTRLQSDKEKRHVLLFVLQYCPNCFSLIPELWEKYSGTSLIQYE